jgi:hypothetical protein
VDENAAFGVYDHTFFSQESARSRQLLTLENPPAIRNGLGLGP